MPRTWSANCHYSVTCPCGWVVNALGRCVVERDALSGRGLTQPGASAYQRIISNNSYALVEQGGNPRQVRGFDCVVYKLWPLLMPWLAASRYQPCWRAISAMWGKKPRIAPQVTKICTVHKICHMHCAHPAGNYWSYVPCGHDIFEIYCVTVCINSLDCFVGYFSWN